MDVLQPLYCEPLLPRKYGSYINIYIMWSVPTDASSISSSSGEVLKIKT